MQEKRKIGFYVSKRGFIEVARLIWKNGGHQMSKWWA
jgi:hypothetical protein